MSTGSWASRLQPGEAAKPQPAPGAAKPCGGMRYVPPPTNAQAYRHPQAAKAPAPEVKWDKPNAGAKPSGERTIDGTWGTAVPAVGVSGADEAHWLSSKTEFDIWTPEDVKQMFAWCRAEHARIPNGRNAKGGRLHKLTNILCNGCDPALNKITRNQRYIEIMRTTGAPTEAELQRMFMAPLGKKLVGRIAQFEREEAEKRYEEQFDDDDEMAM